MDTGKLTPKTRRTLVIVAGVVAVTLVVCATVSGQFGELLQLILKVAE